MRCIVSRRIKRAGLGDRLATLTQIWWSAVMSNRTLVIDWRDNTYTSNNLFDCLFKPIKAISHPHYNVRIISGNNIRLPEPIFTVPKGELISKSACSDIPTVVVNEFIPNCCATDIGFVNENILPAQLHRIFLSSLELKDQWQEVCNQFINQVDIGVIIRHGNGEWKKHQRRHINDLDDYCDKIANKINEIGGSVFLSADSKLAVDVMKDRVPDIIWREHWLPPIGKGPIHHASSLSQDPIKVAADGIINMKILSSCHHLIADCRSKFATVSASMGMAKLHCV